MIIIHDVDSPHDSLSDALNVAACRPDDGHIETRLIVPVKDLVGHATGRAPETKGAGIRAVPLDAHHRHGRARENSKHA